MNFCVFTCTICTEWDKDVLVQKIRPCGVRGGFRPGGKNGSTLSVVRRGSATPGGGERVSAKLVISAAAE
jgi:hypothetical protein